MKKEYFFIILLSMLMLIISVAIVRSRDLLIVVIYSSIFSLILASSFFLLDAVDVALTEAAIGAGISTVLFLSALSVTSDKEKIPNINRSNLNVVSLIIVGISAIAIIYATFDQPRFADSDSPIHSNLSSWYLKMTGETIDIPNVVTAILGNFRGYDTLGEVFVVFTAGIGVIFLLRKKSKHKQSIQSDDFSKIRHYAILRLVGRMLIPFIFLFGLYIQFHGESGPGGGFQAGAFIASSIILYALIDGQKQAMCIVPKKMVIRFMVSGTLLYGGVGLICLFLGGNFLDYSVLHSDPAKGQQIGLFFIESGVGITVTGVLLSIFYDFSMREQA